ncbi:MAG: hypothetical protein IKZ88_05420 [Neisseriaceae bacterium]|nr:hypothetical protein [Neisseriaceae bacterium]
MCDLSRGMLQPLSIMDKVKSIHRVPDATPLEIEFAEYILRIKESGLKDLREGLSDLLNDISSMKSSIESLDDDVKEIVDELFPNEKKSQTDY